jgi:hypothetical protein
VKVDLGSMRIKPDNTGWVAGAVGHAQTGAIRSQLYLWRPPPWARPNMPKRFALTLRCATFPDNVRRLYPAGTMAQFINDAFDGGLALFTGLRLLTREQRGSYREAFLLYRRLLRTREHLGNKLSYPKSLRVTARGRGLEEVWSILPDGAEFNGGRGKKLTVEQVKDQGRRELQKHDVRDPRQTDCLVHGLIDAARSATGPEVAPGEVAALIRCALYDAGPLDAGQPPGVMTVELVRERLHRALGPHLGDDKAEFSAWFLGPKNSLVEQICKGTRASPGRLDRQVVKRVLQDLGWQAYGYVADCILVMMWAFGRVLPAPLTEAERRCFEGVYFRQPHFGGLPLVLLAERMAWLGPVVWQLWESPSDGEEVRVLHRLLAYYAAMARTRREIDQKLKQKSGDGSAGEVGVECLLDEDQVVAPEQDDTYLQIAEIAERLRAAQGLRCRCANGSRSWEAFAEGLEGDTVVLRHSCQRCGFVGRTETPLADVRAVMGVTNSPAEAADQISTTNAAEAGARAAVGGSRLPATPAPVCSHPLIDSAGDTRVPAAPASLRAAAFHGACGRVRERRAMPGGALPRAHGR